MKERTKEELIELRKHFYGSTWVDVIDQLLAEMEKPKVWDGAPDDAHTAIAVWYSGGQPTHSKDYTRTLPKTRAREIAEEIASQWAIRDRDREAVINEFESAILRREKELEGK